MVYHGIELPLGRIALLCRHHHIRRLAVFGSILTDEFRPESDVDMLVEFEPGRTPGLGFFSIQRELSELIGRPVDLNTPQDLSRYYRDEVLAQARPIYAQE
ncbi:MAG: nucleotidyltransferase family protein [Candidatus Eisenbacteria bacterium]|nr:nucleotidyltransferase family protein [Candidatus Eisenbacteria bacterium]